MCCAPKAELTMQSQTGKIAYDSFYSNCWTHFSIPLQLDAVFGTLHACDKRDALLSVSGSLLDKCGLWNCVSGAIAAAKLGRLLTLSRHPC